MAAANKPDSPPNKHVGDAPGAGIDPWTIESMPAGLIDRPLDFIFAEHIRQREAAAILSKIANGDFDERGVRDLIEFLESDFALHIGDEEVALFPLLSRRCLPEDHIDRMIERLRDEHIDDESIGEEVIAVLRARLKGQPLSDAQKRRLRAFSEHILQHLALENGVLLPIARVRLSEDDMNILADLLRRRR